MEIFALKVILIYISTLILLFSTMESFCRNVEQDQPAHVFNLILLYTLLLCHSPKETQNNAILTNWNLLFVHIINLNLAQ